jgi:DNA-binding NarL/FixJ family response regulator
MSTRDPTPPADATDARDIRVLVADDQALIRRGLALMIEAQPGLRLVGQAEDGEAALRLAAETHPDVVLMDLNMPRLGGVAATRRITREMPGVRIVVLTTFDADDLVFDALQSGASAYLLKDASEDDVVEAIRAVHRGESRMTPAIARKVIDQFRLLAARVPVAEAAATANAAELEPLTDKEAKILDLIAEGLGNREIANRIFLAEGTVKNYVSRIMEKLQARSRTELAVIALRERRS